MMFQSGDFQVTLPSNACPNLFPTNRPQSYKTRLAIPLELHGQWQVSIMEIQYPRDWFNLQKGAAIHFIEGLTTETAGKEKTGEWFEMYNQAVKERMKAKSVNVWHISINPGNYAGPNDLGERIISKCKSEYKISVQGDVLEEGNEYPIEFKYDAIEANSSFDAARLVMCFEKESPLLKMLGMVPKNDNPLYAFGKLPMRSTKPPYMEPWSSIYVYTDIIQPQLVGDSLVPLIGVVPVIGKDVQVAHWTFNPPYYLPLSRSYISNIELELKTDSGELLPIQKGKVACRLHFRKVSDD